MLQHVCVLIANTYMLLCHILSVGQGSRKTLAEWFWLSSTHEIPVSKDVKVLQSSQRVTGVENSLPRDSYA